MSAKSGAICAVYGCNNYKKQKDSKSFFRMPKNKQLLQTWITACKRKDLDEKLKINEAEYFNKTFVVCSDHFDQNCFRNKNNFSQGLFPQAVPTLNLYNVPIVKKRKFREIFEPENMLNQKICTEEMNVPAQVVCEDMSLEEENKKLRATIEEYRKKLSNKTSLLSKYKSKIQKLKRKDSIKQPNSVQNVGNKMTIVCEQFINTQLRLQNKPKMGRRYDNNDKEFALALYYCSTKSYVMLQNFFCLPSLSSLRLWLNNLQVACGINQTVLQLLSVKSSKLRIEERVVSLIFDEMSLQQSLNYDAHRDVFEGFEDFGDHRINSMRLCNHAMVIMIKGLYLDFKQVIGYYLTKDAIAAEDFKGLFLDCIKKVQETGFIIKTVACDLGSNNVKLRKILNVTKDEPYINFNNQKIYFFYDAPHLLKCVRNNLKKYNIRHGDKIYSWSHIVDFYNIDSQQIPRLAPKLTKKCIDLPPFSPMRVCLAANTLSYSVYVGILSNVTLNNLHPSATQTADFIENIDSLFDIFNSAKYKDKKFRRPLSTKSKHLEKLIELKKFLGELQFLNNRLVNPICINGWIANINALSLLWKDLHENFNFKFLFTRRLTQDCIENLFSVIRYKGGNNITPDAVKFRCSLRSVMSNQLLQPSSDSNSEIDACSFLLQKQELTKPTIEIKENKSNTVGSPICLESNLNVNLAEKNSENYVLGWVCSQVPHEECKEKLSSLENDYNILNTHIELKKYSQTSKLLFPNEKARLASDMINKLFKSKIDDLVKESVKNVKKKLISICETQINFNCICEGCKLLFLNKYFNVLIKAYINRINDSAKSIIAKKIQTKSAKLKKVVHA